MQVKTVGDLTRQDIRVLADWYRQQGDEEGAEDFEFLVEVFDRFADEPEGTEVGAPLTLKDVFPKKEKG